MRTQPSIRYQEYRWRKSRKRTKRMGELVRFVHCSVTSGHNEFFRPQLKPLKYWLFPGAAGQD
jgi:hypothetical protein